MKFNRLVASAFGLRAIAALPVESRQDSNLDVTVLQFALTLEHLENAFYVGALNNLSAADFAAAGYPATYYQNLKYIASDEQSHVQLLTTALQAAGASPVSPCIYNFPYTDVPSFITLSSVLEGVGTSAYLGGAPLITSKAYLTVAGSILVTEALHTSYQRAAIAEVPFANPYGTPLDPTSVFTLAASFIVSCPASNFALPFTPFPALAYNATESCSSKKSKRDVLARRAAGSEPDGWESSSDHYPSATVSGYSTASTGHPTHTPSAGPCPAPSAGDHIVLTAAKTIPAGSYVTFISGLSVVSVQGTIAGDSVTVTIPNVAQGQTYVLITNGDVEGTLVDSKVLFGPAIVEVMPPPPTVDLSI